MTLTNNTEWNITCSGSEPSGYNSIGGAPVGPAYQSKPGYVYSIDRLPGLVTVFKWVNRMVLISIPFYALSNSTPLFWGHF